MIFGKQWKSWNPIAITQNDVAFLFSMSFFPYEKTKIKNANAIKSISSSISHLSIGFFFLFGEKLDSNRIWIITNFVIKIFLYDCGGRKTLMQLNLLRKPWEKSERERSKDIRWRWMDGWNLYISIWCVWPNHSLWQPAHRFIFHFFLLLFLLKKTIHFFAINI